MEPDSHNAIQKAMALRVKYRRDQSNPKSKLGLSLLGVHPMNRGGHEVYPNSDDVKKLGLNLIKAGFDYAEANHNGVAVEEFFGRVAAVAAHDTLKRVGEYNYQKCLGSPALGQCFGSAKYGDIIAGTLSHSHLLLVLLCIKGNARWNIDDGEGNMTYPCDPSGRLDSSAVADKDGVLKKLLVEGLDMEVLSHQIYVEEPEACTLISNALNLGNTLALRSTTIQALSSLTGAVAVSAATQELNFDVIKQSLRSSLDVFVDDPDFIEMFDFVVQMGGGLNKYLPEFFEFTSKCVSSQYRQLRSSIFAGLNKLDAGPRSKIAIMKRSLRSKPNSAGACPLPESDLKDRPRWQFDILEDHLQFYHKTCLAAVAAAIPLSEQPVFFGNVDGAAADAFAKGSKDSKRYRVDNRLESTLVRATAKYWSDLQRKTPDLPICVTTEGTTFPDALKELAVARAAKASPFAVADTATRAMPVLIRYDEDTGRALACPQKRAIVSTQDERRPLPWRSWLKSINTMELTYETTLECAARTVLNNFHTNASAAEGHDAFDDFFKGNFKAPIDVLFDPQLKTTVVVTTDHLKAGSLELAPCIPTATGKLRTESTHPERVAIEAFTRKQGKDGTPNIFYAHPEWNHPEEKTIDPDDPDNTPAVAREAAPAVASEPAPAVASEPAAAVRTEHRLDLWTGKETMHPHWAVRRLTREALATKCAAGAIFNCEQKIKECSVAVVNEMETEVVVVRVPVLTNKTDLPAGVELLWEANVAKKKVRQRVVDWKQDQTQKEKEVKKLAQKRKSHAMTHVEEI